MGEILVEAVAKFIHGSLLRGVSNFVNGTCVQF